MIYRNVEEFVRKGLGCDCAEEVFRRIDNEHGVRVAGIPLRNRIDVGGRLLVYVADPGDLGATLPALVEAGRGERDSGGFNRFRLVLVSGDAALKERAFRAFRDMPGADEKIHLHVVENDGVMGL